MIPVEQTILTPPDGNCMAACIASILELPLDEVPNYYGDGWYERFQDWFHERGYCLISWDHSDSEGHATAVKRIGYAILNAQSPRGNYGHAVVTYGGEIVWDPSPHRDMGVGRYLDWCVIVPLNPTRAPSSAEIWAAAEDSCPECESMFRVQGRLIHGPKCSRRRHRARGKRDVRVIMTPDERIAAIREELDFDDAAWLLEQWTALRAVAEAAEAEPEPMFCNAYQSDECAHCHYNADDNGASRHAPDCPYVLRWAALQRWKGVAG